MPQTRNIINVAAPERMWGLPPMLWSTAFLQKHFLAVSSYQAQLIRNNVTDQHAECVPFSPQKTLPSSFSFCVHWGWLIDFLNVLLALWLPVMFGQWEALARDGESLRSELYSPGFLPTDWPYSSIKGNNTFQAGHSSSSGSSLWLSITIHSLSIQVLLVC